MNGIMAEDTNKEDKRETSASKLAKVLAKRDDEYDTIAVAYLKLHAKHEELEADYDEFGEDYDELLVANEKLYNLADEFEDDYRD